jgi:hypothetical protein
VARIGYPGTKEVVIAGLRPSDGHASRIAVRGRTVHVVLEQHEIDFAKRGPPVRTCQWWAIDLDTKTPRRVATGLPPVGGLWESAHYGFVALVQQDNKHMLHTVGIADPSPKK